MQQHRFKIKNTIYEYRFNSSLEGSKVREDLYFIKFRKLLKLAAWIHNLNGERDKCLNFIQILICEIFSQIRAFGVVLWISLFFVLGLAENLTVKPTFKEDSIHLKFPSIKTWEEVVNFAASSFWDVVRFCLLSSFTSKGKQFLPLLQLVKP